MVGSNECRECLNCHGHGHTLGPTPEPQISKSTSAKHIHEFRPTSSGFRLLFCPSTLAPEGAAHENQNAPTSGHWLAIQLDPHAQATRKAKVLRFQLAIWQLCAKVAGSRGRKKEGIERCTLTGTGQFVIPVLFAPHVKVKVLSGNLRSRAVRASASQAYCWSYSGTTLPTCTSR
ncbi:hypothetical protein BDN71DRAFT_1457251 [Pleurotus eryngii]|uniref:Uncharacterized protein n=1 Tax=Pleurotus eryngii TaxID=5323 RepID=A0A9P6D2D2_PLEER|nr:hypothetical protein BDN71DRAFT_1457251 [Pleurotus eryngii]